MRWDKYDTDMEERRRVEWWEEMMGARERERNDDLGGDKAEPVKEHTERRTETRAKEM